MKKAIGYSRISTKEQSNYSLDGQRNAITDYCAKQEIQLLEIFEDDGQSAKNFDRISWQQLETFIQQRHKEIDYLIVYKYDRFSRNLTEALAMIDKLEKKYKIVVLSLLENIGVHPKSPMFFYMRTQLLLNANTELNYIRERTAFGMHQGAKSGRYLHAAPFGYKNARDDDKKPIIVPDEKNAYIVQQAFKLFLSGMNMEDISRILKPDGLNRGGNSAIRRILENPTYAGMIKVPSYYDEPEQLIEGKHQAIIDKATYWAVQDKLSGKQNNRHNNEEVPLRGSLHCECGRYMTAGNSKGKSKYYWYYICPTCKENHSAITLHKQFDDLLGELSLPEHYIEQLQNEVIDLIEEEMKGRNNRVSEKQRELNQLEAKIEELEEKYISNAIDQGTYDKWKVRYENERFSTLNALDDLKAPLADAWAKYSENLHKLTNMHYLFSEADIHNKKSFIELEFDSKLYYADGFYRTPYLLPVFGLKALPLKEKGLLLVEQPSYFVADLQQVPQTGIEPVLALRQTGFSYHYNFRCLIVLWSGLSLHHIPYGT
ncbi:MAG: site-specific recombinase, invertase Pin [Flavipsychrobacter sp.]|jgi:DNA invertase Pin-like site-specific DNA recombinase|nr:site-specific recombinase, invertase Pin [Flavipsychrobacter sp.]